MLKEKFKSMSKKTTFITIIIVFIILLMSGCTQKNLSDKTQTLDKPEDEINPPELESLYTILSKTDSIISMYYEIDASIYMSEFGSQSANIKIWQKTPYLKQQIKSIIDEVTTMITVIQRPDGIYMYDSEIDKYITANEEVNSISTSLQYFNSEIIKNYVENLTSDFFETDIIDGKKSTIIQYEPLEGDYPMTIKLWIWNENGLPLKAYIDMKMKDITMTMDFIFSGYLFSDIPDSTFSIS
jgi:outer membrane lipoprotein-sorting protein